MFLTLYLIVIATICPVTQSHLRVVGNLAIVATPLSHASSEDDPVKISAGELWCGAQRIGEHIGIKYAEFTRLRDGKVFEADIRDQKALLNIGRGPATMAGKYRCDVRTEYADIISGNMFIYLPPVLILPPGFEYTEVANAVPPQVKGPTHSVSMGENLTLSCPVFSYPPAFVRWEKNGEPVASSSTILFDGNNLNLLDVNNAEIGIYRCIADNSFPLFVDGPSMPHQLYYDQVVKLS